MSPERFKRIQAVLARRQPDLAVVMENVHKTHNLAAIARSCDAVGVQDIHAIANQTGLSLNKKTSMGSHQWVTLYRHEDIVATYQALRDRGMRILATHLDRHARDYREVDYTQPTAVVVGGELEGLSSVALEEADGTVFVPMDGMVQSLNVSVATAIILSEARRQRDAAGMYDESRMDPDRRTRLAFEWAHPVVAEYCRRRGLPYPAMDENGDMIEQLADRGGPASLF